MGFGGCGWGVESVGDGVELLGEWWCGSDRGVEGGGHPGGGAAAVSVAEVDATVDLSLDKAPTGGGTIVSLVARQVGARTTGCGRYLRPSSVVQLLRVVNGSVTTVASASLALPGGAYVPGQVMHLRFRLTGSGPTALAGKAWFGAAAEPAAWQVQAVDATAQLQQPGGLGVEAYVSSSSTNVPVTLSADNLSAVRA